MKPKLKVKPIELQVYGLKIDGNGLQLISHVGTQMPLFLDFMIP